tara:strand:+ start:782 stop:946 length:165 start_codon:yes stop_codon:yes gene_type:complete
MTPNNNLKCFRCVHLSIKGCKAFPEGVPNIILSGKSNHSEPLKGQDNDIVFESI